jgi:hypothetical protein
MHKFIRGTNDLPAHTGDIYWMESLAGRRSLQLNEVVGMGAEVLRMRRQQRPEGQAAVAAEYRYVGKIAQASAAQKLRRYTHGVDNVTAGIPCRPAKVATELLEKEVHEAFTSGVAKISEGLPVRHINAGRGNDLLRQSDTGGNTGVGHGKVGASGTRLNTYEAPNPPNPRGVKWVRRSVADAGNPASTAVVTTIRPAIPKLWQFSYAPSPNFTTQRFASLAAEQGPATECTRAARWRWQAWH